MQNGSDRAPPPAFICPITHELMVDPVLDPTTGTSYERAEIAKWLAIKGTSPLAGIPLTVDKLIPNHALRDAIEAWSAAGSGSAPGPVPKTAVPPAASTTSTVYVRDVPSAATEGELMALFQAHGVVASVHILVKHTKRMAFVNFTSPAWAAEGPGLGLCQGGASCCQQHLTDELQHQRQH